MAESFNGRRRIRKLFGHISEIAKMPNLIEVQKSSYDDFLMVKEPPGGRPNVLNSSSVPCSRWASMRGIRRAGSIVDASVVRANTEPASSATKCRRSNSAVIDRVLRRRLRL